MIQPYTGIEIEEERKRSMLRKERQEEMQESLRFDVISENSSIRLSNLYCNSHMYSSLNLAKRLMVQIFPIKVKLEISIIVSRCLEANQSGSS